MTNELKLEVGRTYLNPEGEKIKLVEKTNAKNFPYFDEFMNSYMEDGRYFGTKSEFDLVSLVPEEDAPAEETKAEEPAEAPKAAAPVESPPAPEPALVIEVGKFYRTRNDQKVRILATDRKGSGYEVVGLIDYGKGEAWASWTKLGKYNINEKNHTLDLVAPWIDPPVVNWAAMPAWAKWVAMDEDGVWSWFETKPWRVEETTKPSPEWQRHGSWTFGMIPSAFAPTYCGPWQDSLVERPKE